MCLGNYIYLASKMGHTGYLIKPLPHQYQPHLLMVHRVCKWIVEI